MNRWYVIQTKYKQTQTAIDNLTKQKFRVYNPLVVEVKARDKELMVPLFGNYMFVQFNIKKDMWRKISSTKGVARLIGSTDSGCAALPKGFIEDLIKRSDVYGHLSPEKANNLIQKYAVGDELNIINGQFKGFVGVCEGITKDSVKILFTLLNNKVSVSLSYNSVSRLSLQNDSAVACK